MSEQHQKKPPKHEQERLSGTGIPIKGENKRQGGGTANWGSNQDNIKQGVEEFQTGKQGGPNAPRQPKNQADLNEIEKESEQKTSYDDFAKQANRQQAAYNTKTVASEYRKTPNLNKSEQETDLLFAGDQKDKKKRNKKKKTKQLLLTSFTYDQSQNDQENGSRGGGRGRGYDNQNRGGFGYGRSGFGSRGRGRQNVNFDNSNNNPINDQNNANQNTNQSASLPQKTKQVYRKKETSQTTTENNTNQTAQPQTTEQSNQQSSNQ